jgi:hypothetical protein
MEAPSFPQRGIGELKKWKKVNFEALKARFSSVRNLP